MPLLYHKKEGFISRIFIGYFEVTKDEVITKEHPPTDDGTAMVVFIYGILKTLLVMFFRLASFEIKWQVSDKNTIYSIQPFMDLCYEQ